MEKNKMPTTSWISVLVTPCRCSRKRPVPDSGGRQPPPLPARSESKPNEAVRNSVSVDVGEQSDIQQAYPLRYAKKEVPDFCTLNSSFASRSPSEYCRQNGFELPLNLFQLLSWLLFLAVVVLVYLLLAFSFSVATIISLGTLFFVIVTVTGYAAIVVTRSDPSDERIAKHWELPNKGCSTHVGPGEVICDLCGPIDPRSKHCRVCNKCVAQFDHHCKWLNNCIGEVNYKMFFVLITSVALLTLVAVSLALAVVIKNVQSDSVRNYWEQRLGYFSPAGLYTLVTLTFVLNLPLFVLDVQLLFLHVYLVFVGITTYEYITRRVQEPPPEDSADPDVSATRCCADWVVIDRKRLRRARERFRRHKRSSSFSGSEAEHKPEETTGGATIAQPSDCTPAAIA